MNVVGIALALFALLVAGVLWLAKRCGDETYQEGDEL